MSQCPRCQANFSCGMVDTELDGAAEAGAKGAAADGAQPCWCTALAHLPADVLGNATAQCYCPACLRQIVQQVGASTRS